MVTRKASLRPRP